MSPKIAHLETDDSEMPFILDIAPAGTDIGWVDSTKTIEAQASLMKDTIVIFGDATVELVRKLPNVKLVQVASAGTDRLDVAGLASAGVPVANGGGANSIAVSEHAIALMISVFRKLNLQMESARAGKWSGFINKDLWSTSHELTGKTVGIIGLGNIGQNVAQRLKGWECQLLYHDAVERSQALESKLEVSRVSRNTLLKSADIITLHVPLLPSTTGMISDDELDLMKDSAILINTCRGPVVDEAALIRGLQAGKISGAGLDVLEQEPPEADNPLLDMDNVVVTPHLASFAKESSDRSRQFAIENSVRVVNGESPLAIVPPA
jgi:phosphoglycerate dehydrogenase-like enzyme